MGTLKRAGEWVIAAIVGAALVALAWWLRRVLRDHQAAANALATAAEKKLVPVIKRKQEFLSTLVARVGEQTKEVRQARQEVNDAKKKLADQFHSAGLTAEEIVARFERLQFGVPRGQQPASSADGPR